MPGRLITRRRALLTGLSSVGGMLLPGCSWEGPPTHGSLLRVGDAFTYAAHRALLPEQSLVREYDHRDISSMPATGTTDPDNETYQSLRHAHFVDWRLSVEGRVRRPTSFSLDELKRLPSRAQITRHTCEEGWTAIAQWTGVPLSIVLNAAGLLPSACFVMFHSFDGWSDSLDLLDAFHPQTIVAYGMNGRDLSVPHGAPVRLRVERQIGYKSMKYLQRIVVVDELDANAGSSGWAWYAGI